MKKLLASVTLAAAGLIGAVPAVHAATTVITTSAPVTFTNTVNGAFSNTYDLTLPASSGGVIGGQGFSFNLSNFSFTAITNFAVQLVNTTTSDVIYTFASPSSSLTGFGASLGSLAAGDYALSFSGSAPAAGSGYGFYSATLSVSPVPEPESYAMMLAGLAVMGAIARKRSQNKA